MDSPKNILFTTKYLINWSKMMIKITKEDKKNTNKSPIFKDNVLIKQQYVLFL